MKKQTAKIIRRPPEEFETIWVLDKWINQPLGTTKTVGLREYKLVSIKMSHEANQVIETWKLIG